MNIQLAKPEHIDAWMALVEQVRDAFPGLETAEAMAEHRATVLKFMQSSSAIWAVDAGRVIGTLLFSRETACCAFWRWTLFTGGSISPGRWWTLC